MLLTLQFLYLRCFLLKRYLTAILIVLSGIIIYFGITSGIYWGGIAAWGIAVILLLLAAYFTKYIPNEKKDRDKRVD